MKDAFGGTFVLKLIMVFFVIYVTFLGVALQIAKAYRIKNGVINLLEQNQYDGSDDESSLSYLDGYLDSIPYNAPTNNTSISKKCKMDTDGSDKSTAVYYHGVCIEQDPNGGNGSDRHYYRVTVYLFAEFPFLGITGNDVITIPVSGETMTIKSYNK